MAMLSAISGCLLHLHLLATTATGFSRLLHIAGNSMYVALLAIAIWGAYCVVVVWMRIAQKRFVNEQENEQFLAAVESQISRGDMSGLEAALTGDLRAMPQLTLLAIRNRKLGYQRTRRLVVDKFQRDVLGDLEHRISWIQTVIKAAPMLGLLGTVLGMMGAFSKLGSGDSVSPDVLAEDIALALITTAIGLAIAIPLTLCIASINVRIRKMQDMVAMGLNQLFEVYRKYLGSD